MFFMKELGPVELAKVIRECAEQNGAEISVSDMTLHRICGDVLGRIVVYAAPETQSNPDRTSSEHPKTDSRQFTLF